MEVEDMEIHKVPDALTTPTKDMNGDWGHGDGSPRNGHGPVEDQLQQQADIKNLLVKLGNFSKSESVTSINNSSEDNERSQDSQEDYEKSGIDMEARAMEEREPPQDAMKTEKGLLEKLQEAAKVKNSESESQNSKEKEKGEEEVITICNKKSEEKRNILSKVNRLATDLNHFVKFENTTVTLGQSSNEYLENFVIPVANLILETICNSKEITSAE